MRLFIASLFFSLFASGVTATTTVPVRGALQDGPFFLAVTCGALPGQACREAPIRWRAREARRLRVVVHAPASGFSPELFAALNTAVDKTIAKLNAVGSGVSLRRADGRRVGDINVYPLVERTGAAFPPRFPRQIGRTLPYGFTNVNFDGRTRNVNEASVMIPSDMRARDLEGVMLKSMTRSLGFMHVLQGSTYRTRSVFSDAPGGAVKQLGPQDLKVLRTVYPSR